MLDPHDDFPNLFVLDHPLVADKLTSMREHDTGRRAFRALVEQIAGLMVYEATRTLPTRPIRVHTPLEETEGVRLAGSPTVVPVLRAGLGLAAGVLDMLPNARVGHIGVSRDEETLRPIEYLSKLPDDLDAGPVLLLDPMLATGGSASFAARVLREAGAKDLRMLCIVAAPDGVRRMLRDHPEMPIYAASLDRELDGHGFIRPGLGDAGDRLFGTGVRDRTDEIH
ncbi:MAG: uracil phosphoribosyltransferase [Phycisphaerales bacterium]